MERPTLLMLLGLMMGVLSPLLLGFSSAVSGFLEKALSIREFIAGQLVLAFSAAAGLASIVLVVWSCLGAAAKGLRAVGLVALAYGGLAVLGSLLFLINVASISGGKLAPLVGWMVCAGVAVFLLGVVVVMLGCRVLMRAGLKKDALHGVRAVLFDMGGTLVDFEPAPETFCKILSAHGVTRPIDEVSAAFEKARKRLGFGRMVELGAGFWIEFNLLVLRDLRITENVLPLAEAIDREWWEYAGFSLYPEALMILNRLKEKGLKMGVVTNSLRADLEKVLSRLGLKDFFDVEVSVDVAGEAKPAEGIFTYAVEKLGLQPKEVLFVGNEVKVDYEGAEKAGLRALVIDRENRLKQGVKKIKDLRGILPVMSTEEK